jgi:hypothetical protein
MSRQTRRSFLKNTLAARAFGDDKEAYESLARMEEHLKGSGLKLEGQKYRLGRKLIIDAKSETIAGDAEANALLTRHYRKPFAVPEKEG